MPDHRPLSPEEWRGRAACSGEETANWYPPKESESYRTSAERAKTVCRGDGGERSRCPVIMECLIYALSRGEDHGIWGGLSPRERGVLRRRASLDDYRVTSGFPEEYRDIVHELLQRGRRADGGEQGTQGPAGGDQAGEQAARSG